MNKKYPKKFPGHTCSVVRRTKQLVHWYLSPLKTEHPGAILDTGDLGDPSDEYGPFSQRYLIRFNGQKC